MDFHFDLFVFKVWRVEWNLTGTILSSTGDDGRVRLWKGTKYIEVVCLFVAAFINQNKRLKTNKDYSEENISLTKKNYTVG